MFLTLFRAATVSLLLGGTSPAAAGDLPSSILRQLPSGYAVLTSTSSTVGDRRFQFVALRSRKELQSERYLTSAGVAPDRPLLIFELRPSGGYVPVGRNDKVIATADGAGLAGNGCDPFEDQHIAIKGSYFTIENGVSCGAHWTDYITFRFEARVGGYVFDNERFESWKLNSGNDPKADAFIPDARRVWWASKGKLVTFSKWRSPTS
ncbi:MAG: hypothetical protein ABI454_12380 [Sphingomicrobium sp.]